MITVLFLSGIICFWIAVLAPDDRLNMFLVGVVVWLLVIMYQQKQMSANIMLMALYERQRLAAKPNQEDPLPHTYRPDHSGLLKRSDRKLDGDWADSD